MIGWSYCKFLSTSSHPAKAAPAPNNKMSSNNTRILLRIFITDSCYLSKITYGARTPCPTSEDMIRKLKILAQQYRLKNKKNILVYPSKTKRHGSVPMAKIIVKTVKGRLLNAGGLRNRKRKYKGAFCSFKFPHPSSVAPKTKLALNNRMSKTNIKILFRISIP